MNRQYRSRLAERIFRSQRTPLLASPQGGECASSKLFRTPPAVRVFRGFADFPVPPLAQPPLLTQEGNFSGVQTLRLELRSPAFGEFRARHFSSAQIHPVDFARVGNGIEWVGIQDHEIGLTSGRDEAGVEACDARAHPG